MKHPLPLPFLAAALAVAQLTGCSKAPEPPPVSGEAHLHHHHAPHAGTVIALGEEEFHVELVLDPVTGKLQAYVLDSELENFVRSSSSSLEIAANVAGTTRTIALAAVANPETGETAGDTALFEGEADWLKGRANFDAVLKSLVVRGTTYSEVKFNFPKGNEGVR